MEAGPKNAVPSTFAKPPNVDTLTDSFPGMAEAVLVALVVLLAGWLLGVAMWVTFHCLRSLQAHSERIRTLELHIARRRFHDESRSDGV